MDLYQLRYFLEVARRLSFTRAAESLHVSPAAVSRSVGLLERSLGKRLFVRDRRHVALTADGETLKRAAERVFDEVEAARLELQAEKVPSMLRLASREMITNYLLPPAIAELDARFPRLAFGLYELEPRAMVAALKSDQIDLGFYYGEIPDAGLEPRPLGRLTSHVYAAKTLLRRNAALRSAKPEDLPFVAPRYFDADPSAASPDGFPDHRVKRQVRFEAEFLETHRRLVLDGLAVGVLPDLVVREELKK